MAIYTVLGGRNAVCMASSFSGHNTALKSNTVYMARILFQNTVLVATVATLELPQFTVSLFPRLAAYCNRLLIACTAGVSPPGKWHLLLALLQTIAVGSIAKY